MKKKKIQKMAFVNPYGKNVKDVKDFIYKIIDEVLNKITNAEKFPPLPKKIRNFDEFNLNDLPITESQILKQIKIIINNSMNASNPYYLGHMDSLPTTMSIVGDIICSAINNNMLSKETAPILTEIENKVTKNLANKFNLGQNSGGTLLSGGTLSNIQAIALARNRILDTFEKGLTGLKRKPYIFASKESHTSIQKAAMVLGLGTNSVVPIETNKNGQMQITSLDKSIREKKDYDWRLYQIGTIEWALRGDTKEINKIIEKVLQNHQDKLSEYKNGKNKLFGFFVGQVMKNSNGKANPKIVNELLKEKLN